MLFVQAFSIKCHIFPLWPHEVVDLNPDEVQLYFIHSFRKMRPKLRVIKNTWALWDTFLKGPISSRQPRILYKPDHFFPLSFWTSVLLIKLQWFTLKVKEIWQYRNKLLCVKSSVIPLSDTLQGIHDSFHPAHASQGSSYYFPAVRGTITFSEKNQMNINYLKQNNSQIRKNGFEQIFLIKAYFIYLYRICIFVYCILYCLCIVYCIYIYTYIV